MNSVNTQRSVMNSVHTQRSVMNSVHTQRSVMNSVHTQRSVMNIVHTQRSVMNSVNTQYTYTSSWMIALCARYKRLFCGDGRCSIPEAAVVCAWVYLRPARLPETTSDLSRERRREGAELYTGHRTHCTQLQVTMRNTLQTLERGRKYITTVREGGLAHRT